MSTINEHIESIAVEIAGRAAAMHRNQVARVEPVFADRDLVDRLCYRLDDDLDEIRRHGPAPELVGAFAARLILLLAARAMEPGATVDAQTEAVPSPEPTPEPEAPEAPVQAAKHPEAPAAPPAVATPPDRASLLTLAEIAEMWACKRDTANWRLKHNKVAPVVPACCGGTLGRAPGLYDLATVLRVGALYVKAPVAAPAPEPDPAPVAPRCGACDGTGECDGEHSCGVCPECEGSGVYREPEAREASAPAPVSEGLTVEQIAARTGLPVGQIRTIARGSTLVEIPGNRPPRYTEASVAALERAYKTRRAA